MYILKEAAAFIEEVAKCNESQKQMKVYSAVKEVKLQMSEKIKSNCSVCE